MKRLLLPLVLLFFAVEIVGGGSNFFLRNETDEKIKLDISSQGPSFIAPEEDIKIFELLTGATLKYFTVTIPSSGKQVTIGCRENGYNIGGKDYGIPMTTKDIFHLEGVRLEWFRTVFQIDKELFVCADSWSNRSESELLEGAEPPLWLPKRRNKPIFDWKFVIRKNLPREPYQLG